VQLLWSNMALHLAADPQALFAAWHRAVAVDGFLMFSTLGTGTLTSLRSLYAAQGWGEPFAPFVDMHDLGDMLVEAGFADPVMDQETLTLTWPDGGRALDELRGLGGNMAMGRTRGLRTPRWRQRLLDALCAQAKHTADGRIALEFEIVYGHAFRPLPRPRVSTETTLLPWARIRPLFAAAQDPGGNPCSCQRRRRPNPAECRPPLPPSPGPRRTHRCAARPGFSGAR
jgi:malonyl-CoA O-methyltransferase